MNFLRSLVFLILAVLITVPCCLLLIPMLLLPIQMRFDAVRLWRQVFIGLERHVLGIRTVILGRENIPDSPCVVLSKHQSAWETVALQELFWPGVFVMKRELLLIPFFGWGLAALRMISIDRKAGKNAMRQVLEQGANRLKRGIFVLIFPEGTRIAPGEHRPFKMGGANLAVDAGVPVVPVAHNAGELWAKNAFIKRPGTITLSVGPAIPTDGLTANVVNAQAEAWVEAEMRKLSPHRYSASAGD